MDFLLFIQDHFFHAAPVLLAGVLGVLIIIDRIKALHYTFPLQNPQGFFEKVSDLIQQDKNEEAVALCDQYIEKPSALVVKAALIRGHLPEDSIEKGVSIALSEVSFKIQKRTAFLATIANVATLMGLFGTIVGLIQSFQAVASASPEQKSALLSAGISTSMNATMLGLGVAIPCMVAYAFLINKSNRLQNEAEEMALKTIDRLKLRHFRTRKVS